MAVRIAVSSLSFRQPLEAGTLTQLEWIERCAMRLGADGMLPAFSHFPRTDSEYVAQLRKVTIDLGIVPFGIDAPQLLALDGAPALETVLGVARGYGAAVIRTQLPPPGDVPPATFVEAVGVAKRVSRAAKASNVTVIVTPAA